jgi:CD109 antigen
MADVFAELELRFLEPQAEVHEGDNPDGEEPPMDDVGFFPEGFRGPTGTTGALDTLHEVGLDMAASKGITVPEGQDFDFWRAGWEVAEGGGMPPMAEPGANGSGPSDDPIRVRQYFPETWLWEPLFLTDETGKATLSLAAPDNITGWKLSVVGTCPAALSGTSGIVFGEGELTAFQEFFVDPSLPYSVVRGEVFPIKVDVFNYLDQEQVVELSLGESEGFEILGEQALSVTVPAGSATAVHFPVRPVALGDFPVQITARGSSLSDAVMRPMKIVPNGVIEAGAEVDLDTRVPPAAVAGSARAYLNLTPSPVAQTMNGVSDLLGMPYGCGEQNMIFLAPDIEILKYLRETGELSPEVRATAEYYVNVGYQRELTFMSDDNGFAAFGGPEGSLWLTAFVLSTFSGAREVRDIDEAVLAGAAGMLVSRQEVDGSFRTDDFLIHQEMDGGLENIYAMAAFFTNALADYVVLAPAGSEPAPSVASALAKSAAYLESHRTSLPGINDDPYSLSIAAVALQKVPGYEAASEAVVDRLLALAETEGIGIHWEPYPVETTGYAAMALVNASGGAGRPEAGAAIEWLSAQRNALGGYGQSTQDTVVAIRALFLAARKVHADLDVTLTVKSDDETIFTLHVDSSNYDLFHQVELPEPLTSSTPPEDGGAQPTLKLVSEGEGSVGFQVVLRYNVPGDLLPPPRDMLLSVVYDAGHIEVDDKVDVLVRLQYTGLKEKTGMVIADVGVPTGFTHVQGTLDALVDAKAVSRVEVAGRKIIFYVESLEKGVSLNFSFQVLALYPVRAEGPVSHVYEYYDPDVEAYSQQGGLVIDEKSLPGPFLRGDSNADGEVNISDPVSTLGYLFLGAWSEANPICRDAADTNDDGTVNITDPIVLLQYLFLGGPAPAAPFPEAGMDPTEDGLDC